MDELTKRVLNDINGKETDEEDDYLAEIPMESLEKPKMKNS